jgi:hypothetical protein
MDNQQAAQHRSSLSAIGDGLEAVEGTASIGVDLFDERTHRVHHCWVLQVATCEA